MMKKKLNRREFVSGVAALAGVTILVACVPDKRSISTKEPQASEPTAAEIVIQPGAEGKSLKVLIVYDSVYGNTKKIAEAMIAGIDSLHDAKVSNVQEITSGNIEDIDLLLVGSPTHGGTFTEPVKNFFASIPANGLAGIKAAGFDTSFTTESQGAFVRFLMRTLGYAAPKIAKKLVSKGAEVLPSEIFYVVDTEGPLKEGEEERAGKWAAALVYKATTG